MMLKQGVLTHFWACFALLLVSCGNEPAAGQPGSELEQAVVVSSPAAFAWTTQLLAGTEVAVWRFHDDGVHVGTTVPDRDAIARARSAKLIVLQGARFEKWAGQTALPSSRTIHLSDACKDDWIEVEERTHAHGGQGEHTHRGVDPHTWQRPDMALKQYRYLAQALKESFPSEVMAIAEAQSGFESKLEQWAEIPIPAGNHVIEHGQGFVYLAQDETAQARAVELPEELFRSLLDADVELTAGLVNRVRSKVGSDGGLLIVSAPLSEARVEALQERLSLSVLVRETLVEHRAEDSAWFKIYERDQNGREWSNSLLKQIREGE